MATQTDNKRRQDRSTLLSAATWSESFPSLSTPRQQIYHPAPSTRPLSTDRTTERGYTRPNMGGWVVWGLLLTCCQLISADREFVSVCLPVSLPVTKHLLLTLSWFDWPATKVTSKTAPCATNSAIISFKMQTRCKNDAYILTLKKSRKKSTHKKEEEEEEESFRKTTVPAESFFFFIGNLTECTSYALCMHIFFF